MKNSVTMKLAASSLVLGVTAIGCTPASDVRPLAVSSKAPGGEAQAAKLYQNAQAAVQQGRLADALADAERAVELAPNDAGYRMLLGDLYLKNGRFQSAESAFGDVLTLDPGNERASFNTVLAQIALGRTSEATMRLEELARTAAPGDVGLAFALAGQPQRAIEMLEPAAREAGAPGRVRQNLALAYALIGDWQKARVTAAQDISPAELDRRMQQWAAFANPKASWDQVASLLGVTPAEDPGQPVRLALAPAAPAAPAAPQPTQFAEVPVAVPEAAPEPAVFAEAAPAPVESAPVPVETEEVRLASAARSLIDAPVVNAVMQSEDPPVAAFQPRKKPRISGRSERAVEERAAKRSSAPFVVQLGAFSSAAGVERAWAMASKRYPFANEREPLSTTVTLPGKGTFHRLSVAGFETHLEASRLCRSIRARGGACFVRTNAGDAPVQWASRYVRNA